MNMQDALAAAARKEKRSKRLSPAQQALADAFDDALAETGSVRESAQRCGLKLPAAEVRFTRMRKSMGWQAQ